MAKTRIRKPPSTWRRQVTEPCVANARQIHGKELSFNNIYDLNGALETVKEFSEEDRPAAVIIKHTNPCGAALGDDARGRVPEGASGRSRFPPSAAFWP